MDRQEAIKIVERNWPDGRSALQEALGVLVPELSRTGKDERIRKMLIERVRNAEELNEELRERIIAYLEKQKEQKPSPSIYWHAIKKGDTLPCRAYLWTPEYEKYHDCFEGRLIPNVENVTVGADMWYLPVDDIQTLPREGIDELPKEQKPEVFEVITSLQQEQPDNEDIDRVAQELYEHLCELKRHNYVPTNLYEKREIIDLWKAGIEYAYNHPKQDQPECIEKTARISPGLLSNFGTSTYVLDVDLTQDEMAKVAPWGFNSGKVKIKIVCE